jgi:hypothetical protein
MYKGPGDRRAPCSLRAAGDFFLEGLSTYKMVQREFREARQAVLHEVAPRDAAAGRRARA